MQPLYKPLEYDYYPRMQQQGTQLALALDLIHNPTTQIANPVDLGLLMTSVPSLEGFLNKYQWQIRSSQMMVMREQTDTGIYCEAAQSYAKVEIPLIGCQYSDTIFYQARINGAKSINNGGLIFQCDPATAKEIDRFSLVTPTIVKTQVPHKTVINRVHVRRISLVLDVGPGAFQLLNSNDSSQ